MWQVLKNVVYDEYQCGHYINQNSTVIKEFRFLATSTSVNSFRGEKFDTPSRNAYRIQEDSLEYEYFETFKLEEELIPFALKIGNESNCSAIVKVYGGMKIETNGTSTTKWWWLYKKNCDSANNSELNLIKPHMNCERVMNAIRIHYDSRKIAIRFSSAVVTCFGSKKAQLQTVNNNKRLKISSKTEKLAIKSVNEEILDYFPILPNEIIAKIFGYFDLKTLARTAQVCSRFNHIISKTNNFYYNLDFKPYWNVFSADVLDRFMDKTKNLRKLDLSWCNQYQNEFYVSKLEEFLNGAKNTLTHLYIDEEKFVLKKSLIKAIFACRELLELHLKRMDLEVVNAEWFNADIIQFKNLRKLDLTDSFINYTTFITIISKTRKLKHLILDSLRIYNEGGDNPFMNNNILEKLVEFDINLETWSSWEWNVYVPRRLSLFPFHRNLEELDFSHSVGQPYDPDSSIIFNFLTKFSRLKRLSLAGFSLINMNNTPNNIKDEHLVTVIENCKKLEQVNISDLQFITASSIKGFLKLENLKFLNIRYCTHETISISQIVEWRKEYPLIQIRTHLR